MAILGTGIDLVDVQRFARAWTRLGDDFLHALFTPGEIATCTATRLPAAEFAARFAAREAVLKALGSGLVGRMSWKDMEVRPAGGRGMYTVVLTGHVALAAAALGVSRVHVAITRTASIAAAAAVLEHEGTKG